MSDARSQGSAPRSPSPKTESIHENVSESGRKLSHDSAPGSHVSPGRSPSPQTESIHEDVSDLKRKQSHDSITKSHESLIRSPSPAPDSIHEDAAQSERKLSSTATISPVPEPDIQRASPQPELHQELHSDDKLSTAKSCESIAESTSSKHEDSEKPELIRRLSGSKSPEDPMVTSSPKHDDSSESGRKLSDAKSHESVAGSLSPKPDSVHDEASVSSRKASDAKSHEAATRSPSPKTESIHGDVEEPERKLSDAKSQDSLVRSPSSKTDVEDHDKETDDARTHGSKSPVSDRSHGSPLGSDKCKDGSQDIGRSPSPHAHELEVHTKTSDIERKTATSPTSKQIEEEEIRTIASHEMGSAPASPRPDSAPAEDAKGEIGRTPSPSIQSVKSDIGSESGAKSHSPAEDFRSETKSTELKTRSPSPKFKKDHSKEIIDQLNDVTTTPSPKLSSLKEDTALQEEKLHPEACAQLDLSKLSDGLEAEHISRSPSPRTESLAEEDRRKLEFKSSENLTRSPSPKEDLTHDLEADIPTRSPSPKEALISQKEEIHSRSPTPKESGQSPSQEDLSAKVSKSQSVSTEDISGTAQKIEKVTESTPAEASKTVDATEELAISKSVSPRPESTQSHGDPERSHSASSDVDVKIVSPSFTLEMDGKICAPRSGSAGSDHVHDEVEYPDVPHEIQRQISDTIDVMIPDRSPSPQIEVRDEFNEMVLEKNIVQEVCSNQVEEEILKESSERQESLEKESHVEHSVSPAKDEISDHKSTSSPSPVVPETDTKSASSDKVLSKEESRKSDDDTSHCPTPPPEKHLHESTVHSGYHQDPMEEPLLEELDESAECLIEEQPVYGNTLQADFAELVTLSEANTPSEPQSPLDAKVKLVDSTSKIQSAPVKGSTSASDVQSAHEEVIKSSHVPDDYQWSSSSRNNFVPPPYEFDHDIKPASVESQSKDSNGHGYRVDDIMTASFHETYAEDSDYLMDNNQFEKGSSEKDHPATIPTTFRGVWDPSVRHVEPPVVSNGSPSREASMEGSSQLIKGDHHSTKAELFSSSQEPEGDCMTSSFYDFGDDDGVPVEEGTNGRSYILHSTDVHIQPSEKKDPLEMTTSFSATSSASTAKDGLSSSEKSKEFKLEDWGKPLGLPSPPEVAEVVHTASTNKSASNTPKAAKTKVSASNKEEKKSSRTIADNGGRPNSGGSPSKSAYSKSSSGKSGREGGAPVYVDLTYVPHHANPFYCNVEFFQRVRARYYVFSGTNPSKEVFNALLEAKRSWEDKNMEVTIIPTYETDTLGYWMASNQDLLTELKIDVAPSANRCTISLQDHETSCAAYRLEF